MYYPKTLGIHSTTVNSGYSKDDSGECINEVCKHCQDLRTEQISKRIQETFLGEREHASVPESAGMSVLSWLLVHFCGPLSISML